MEQVVNVPCKRIKKENTIVEKTDGKPASSLFGLFDNK
jgi:hypothetical protein